MAELRNSLIYWGRSMEKYFMLMLVIKIAGDKKNAGLGRRISLFA